MSEQRIILLIWTLLAIMALSCALGARYRSGAVLLALSSFAWLLVNTTFEGETLWVVSSTHGLTTSDLAGLLGMLVAAGQLWRLSGWWRPRIRRGRRSHPDDRPDPRDPEEPLG